MLAFRKSATVLTVAQISSSTETLVSPRCKKEVPLSTNCENQNLFWFSHSDTPESIVTISELKLIAVYWQADFRHKSYFEIIIAKYTFSSASRHLLPEQILDHKGICSSKGL